MLDAVRTRGVVPARILEPTCGSGAFLAAAATTFPRSALLGIEYQRERYASSLEALAAGEPGLRVRYGNAYETDFADLPWPTRGPLLIVGNPPWVTAAALGRVRAGVLQPPRSNPKGLRGLAARTGAANFDVAEFLILKLLDELRAEPLQLAMLVKESVARNVLAAADERGRGIASAEIVRIDARRWFGAAVDACCLLLATTPQGTLTPPVAIRADFGRDPVAWFAPPLASPTPRPTLRFRQGIKHDAAAVFELHDVDGVGVWRNGYGEAVDVESAYVYPLLKARDLHSDVETTGRALVVPQTRLGAATDELQTHAPRLWRYLISHEARIAARKSSIYRNAPRFALFGVGPYSFAPWKVAVAGFYCEPRFRVVGPRAGRPVVLGDTSYFVAFEREADARAFADLCAHPTVVAAFAARVVPGKRPITKALLDGIDWPGLAARLDRVPERLRAVLGEAVAP